MSRKILIVVIDKINTISKDLARINKPHIFCNIDNGEMYDSIKNGIFKYCDKFFITSSVDIVYKILQDFPKYHIIYIDFIKSPIESHLVDTTFTFITPNKKFPFNVETYQNVNEPVYRYISEGILYLSAKEIETITKNNTIDTAIKIDLTIVLAGKVDLTVSISNLKKILDSIHHNRILSEKYVLDTIDTIYCGDNRDLLKNTLFLDKIIDFLDEKNTQHDILTHIKFTNMYDLVDRTKYLHYWRGLYGVLNNLQYPPTSKQINKKLIMILNISNLDQSCNRIDIKNQIIDIIEYPDHENIYIYSDILAIGTVKIMHYYMTLYNHYGSYQFKEHIRDVSDNGILTQYQYTEMPIEVSLRSDIQLLEHIYRFSDLVMTRIRPYILNTIMPINLEKRKSLILVTYYGIYEQFIYVESIFRKLGYEVHDFPYNKYLSEKGKEQTLDTLLQMIDDIKPNYLLWWILNIDANDLYTVVSRNKNIKHLYFNWDEPYNWKHCDLRNKAKYLDYAFITCNETVVNYINAGTKNAYCVYTGYTPKIHYPIWLDKDVPSQLLIKNIEYKYDISFICTNLYSDKTTYPDQIVDRKKLIDTIYLNQKIYDYTFAIFGPENFKDLYPDSYKGFIKYNDTADIFNRSKINLCTHVVGNKKGYLNERIFMIMASGGLLMVDPIPGVEDILINGENCMMIDQNRIIRQIKNILSNYLYYNRIKINAYNMAKKYTWDDWGMRIEEKLMNNKSIS
jgi:hypothetical protein